MSNDQDIEVSNETDDNVSEAVEQEVAEPSESETKARRLGWVPKDEFRGNPDQWRDADEFLRRGEEIHGFMKADLQRLQQTISQRDREIAEMRSAMDEFRKFHNETESRAYKRAIEELKQLKVSAIEQGDGAKVIQIDDEIDKLKEAQNRPAVSAPQPQGDPQLFNDWIQENRWYAEDSELHEIADDFGDAVRSRNPNLTGIDFLNEVAKRVKRARPDKFENPARSKNAVSSSSDSRAPASGSKKKGYANLPAEAKAACDMLVKQKLLTVDEYVANYEW